VNRVTLLVWLLLPEEMASATFSAVSRVLMKGSFYPEAELYCLEST
jgi:hypothetical protein